MTLEERIQAGLNGDFEGIDNGFITLNKLVYGVQKTCLSLIGGLSGTYKTTLLDYIILNAIEDCEKKNIPFNIHYYSFEIDEITKKCNWLSVRIFNKHGIDISPEIIKGFGNNRLTEEQLYYVNLETPYIEQLFKKINFTFAATNPTGIYRQLWNFMSERGTFVKSPYINENNETKEKIDTWIPNDPKEYNIVALDHYALLKKERSFGTKEVIDKMSEYFVELRNMFKLSIFVVQQFNRSLSSVERLKFKGVDLSPQESDFKDSGNGFHDSDVVYGLLNPYKLDMDSCLGYNIKILQDQFLMLKVIKNRLGRDNTAIGLLAKPQSGSFLELPDPKSAEIGKLYEKMK